jgi:hypothetical protein
MVGGSSIVQVLVLAPGLALRGMALGSHLINNDNAAWRWVVSLFTRALTRVDGR